MGSNIHAYWASTTNDGYSSNPEVSLDALRSALFLAGFFEHKGPYWVDGRVYLFADRIKTAKKGAHYGV